MTTLNGTDWFVPPVLPTRIVKQGDPLSSGFGCGTTRVMAFADDGLPTRALSKAGGWTDDLGITCPRD